MIRKKAKDMITDSVGEKGRNYPLDVARVQKLINQNLRFLINRKSLIVDGVAGNETITAIIEYQKLVLKMKNTVGCIEPNRTTINWLMKTARKPRPQNIDTFIIKVLPTARKIKTKYQIPVSVLIAQAALDSEWGHKTSTDRKVDDSYFHLDEHDATFKGLASEAEDYGRYLKTNPRFIQAFAYKQQPLIFAKKLQEITDINDKNNTNSLSTIINKYHLTELDH